MSTEKKPLKNSKLLIFLVALAAIAAFASYILRDAGQRSSAAPGIPTLSYAIEPSDIRPNDGFDLIIKVNPNGATFNAFELYTNYDPNLVDFQDSANLSQNISSSYILINSSVDTANNLINIVGTATNNGFSGNSEMEIARVLMKVNDGVSGDINFVWDQRTRVGNKLDHEKLDGLFPITVDTFPTDEPLPTDIPVPTDVTGGGTSLSFKVRLPDVSSPIVSLSDVKVELRDGATVVDTANINLVQSGQYYQTGSPITFNNVTNNSYQVYVKTKISLGRLFFNVNLTPGVSLNCVSTTNPDCGDLISQVDSKLLESGDSDGFDTSSGSYNLIDSADLQVLNQFFNQPAGAAQYSADFNLDGQVNISDLEIIGKNYGLQGD